MELSVNTRVEVEGEGKGKIKEVLETPPGYIHEDDSQIYLVVLDSMPDFPVPRAGRLLVPMS